MKDNENKAFAKAIKKHLDAVAAVDPAFAKAYANPEKSITSCCNDIIGWVKAKGASVVAAEEVFGRAIHYYVDGKEPKEAPGCKVVVCEGMSQPDDGVRSVRRKKVQQTEELPSLFAL